MTDKKTDKQDEADKLAAMPLDEKILYHYQHGQGSIQDIARVYRLDVDKVLTIIGEGDLTVVHTEGDMIDEAEKGNAGTPMNYGQDFKVPFDLS